MIEAQQAVQKAQEDGAALEQRHRQERRRLLADTFGAEAVRRDPSRYELTHPDREAARAASTAAKARGEADLRGVLSNDSMTEDEKRQYQKEQELAAEAAKLRDEDYQLAYAVDILRGAAAITVQPEE